MFGYGSLPSAMSGSVALQRLGSGVVSMALVATKGSTDAWGLVSHLGSCWCLGAMLILVACAATGLWWCLVSGSMVLLQLWSVVISMARVSMRVTGTMLC